VLVSAGVLVALGAGQAPAVAGAAQALAPAPDVIVVGPDLATTVAGVRAAGGAVVTELPLLDGVVANLPTGTRLPAGLRVSANTSIRFALDRVSPALPSATVRATLGLPASGQEGRGVTVAVVDTGVAEAGDLAGRVVGHIDVTGTGGGDGFGHGTFMAGLIAASGTGSNGAYRGVAPGARILDVKVAAQDGSTDLASVLKGLQAVADRGPAYGVKVVNLSLTSGSPLPYQIDPLNLALQALWKRGVTVVVSSGNDGPAAGTVSTPGNDPTLLTVGGLDENGTASRTDDTVAAWSSRGRTAQGVDKPDLVAPGAAVIGLRSPGSVIDVQHPAGRVGEQYFRGSGTSMAAAVGSGVVAGVLAANPRLKPDDVKALLEDTAYQSRGVSREREAGSGGLDAAEALAEAPSVRPGRAPAADSAAPGDPERWRALVEAIDAKNVTAANRAWRSLSPEARSWAARSWADLDFSARSWAGQSWAARSWAGNGGTGEEWAARSWAARSWAGQQWTARSWAGVTWAADDWAARSWAGDEWAARSWAGTSWSAIWR
jgi:serine protease AprX